MVQSGKQVLLTVQTTRISRFEIEVSRRTAKWGAFPPLCPFSSAGLMSHIRCGHDMSDWKSLIDQAMMQEGSDTIGAHGTYGNAVRAALANAQLLLTDLEAAQIIESIYGALVAYSQQVMLRMKAEDPEVGGSDHAFRAGQAYGVSCVLNHLIDQLTDVSSITSLEALDDFSDTLHNDILVQARAAGLTVELLDAKGDILYE
jgi:hypothetical protein